jgi:hypothetical protein
MKLSLKGPAGSYDNDSPVLFLERLDDMVGMGSENG